MDFYLFTFFKKKIIRGKALIYEQRSAVREKHHLPKHSPNRTINTTTFPDLSFVDICIMVRLHFPSLTDEITILWFPHTPPFPSFFWLCSGWQNLGHKMLISNLTPWQQSQPSQGWNKESNLTSRDMNFWSVAGRLPWKLTVIPLDS